MFKERHYRRQVEVLKGVATDRDASIKRLTSDLNRAKEDVNAAAGIIANQERQLEKASAERALFEATPIERFTTPVEDVAIKTVGLVKVGDVLVACEGGKKFYEAGVVTDEWIRIGAADANLVLVKR